MMLVFVPLMISDVPTIISTLKGKAITITIMRRRYRRNGTGFSEF
jgi:hypothetical protein